MEGRAVKKRQEPGIKPSSPAAEEELLESSGEVVAPSYQTPPKQPDEKQIHPRRRLPTVPDPPGSGSE
jgi:hypothetical protein